MSENLSILQLRDDRLQWLAPGTDRPRDLDDEAQRARLDAELQQRDHQIVFAVPGGDLRLVILEVAAEERRHLDSALPFMLEEQLSEDIELLHFARQPLDRDRVVVAVVARERMDHWTALLGEYASRLRWLPEPLLWPWNANSWTLVIDGPTAMLRYGEAQGTSVERDLVATLLDALGEQKPPERILVYGQDEARDRQLLPESLQSLAEWRRGGAAAALLLAEVSPRGLDLRQGDYARRLPYERWWSQWRAVAALLLVAVTAQVLAGWLDYRRLERENLALRQEIESVYREVNPRGAFVDAEKQLRRQLAGLRGGGGGESFSALLEPLGEAVADRDGVLLASLSYSQRSGELRVNLLAPSFAVVEGLRQDLVASGLEANLESSSRSGERVRARLTVGAGV